MLSNNVYTACAVCMSYYFSTGGKIRPVSNFMELHALTLVIRSYAWLRILIYILKSGAAKAAMVSMPLSF